MKFQLAACIKVLIFDISADYIFLRWKKTWVSLVTHLVKNPPASRRPWVFDPWVRKMPWRSEWQRTPVFLSGKFHGLRSLVGYSPWGRKESDMSEQLAFSLFKVNQSSDVEWRLSLSESKSLSSLTKLLCFLSSQLMFSGVTLIQHHLRNSSWWWTGKPGVQCCSPWGCQESDPTEWLNWTALHWCSWTAFRNSTRLRCLPSKNQTGWYKLENEAFVKIDARRMEELWEELIRFSFDLYAVYSESQYGYEPRNTN